MAYPRPADTTPPTWDARLEQRKSEVERERVLRLIRHMIAEHRHRKHALDADGPWPVGSMTQLAIAEHAAVIGALSSLMDDVAQGNRRGRL